ncbi:antibiotic biosynthesis monooxygenase [Pseudarthrobacter sp. B907]|uniref:putative quinol monooxygenase n=1 Tax=Pseudarthrobacter sp. B907 TaxID=3158261 RepID=UPI0032DA6F62
MPKDIYTEYTALPGHEQQVTAMINELTLAAILEPGILLCAAYTLDHAPQKYLIFERYLDEQAFESHITSECRRQFTAKMSHHMEDEQPAMTRLNALP